MQRNRALALLRRASGTRSGVETHGAADLTLRPAAYTLGPPGKRRLCQRVSGPVPPLSAVSCSHSALSQCPPALDLIGLVPKRTSVSRVCGRPPGHGTAPRHSVLLLLQCSFSLRSWVCTICDRASLTALPSIQISSVAAFASTPRRAAPPPHHLVRLASACSSTHLTSLTALSLFATAHSHAESRRTSI